MAGSPASNGVNELKNAAAWRNASCIRIPAGRPIRDWILAGSRKGEVSMHYLWIALIGLIVGALAKLIMPGKDPGGIFVTMFLGVAGSFLATFLGRAFGFYQVGQAGFIMSLFGALLLLFVYRLFHRQQPAH